MICLMAFALAACSGLKTGGGPPPPTTGTLSLTVIDTPPANSSILAFKLPITAATLNPQTGSAVPLTLSSGAANLELMRLQSDSGFLGTSTVAAGTYTGLTVTFGTPVITFANQTGAAVSGCANGSVCEITPTTVPSPLTATVTLASALNLTSGGKQGLSLDFNLSNAITFTGGNLVVDLTQTGALSAATLPRGGTAGTSPLDLIEDLTGVVTSVNASAQTLTVESATRGTITATANSSTGFDDFYGLCTSTTKTFASCVALNETVSIDAALDADGSFTLLEFEPFSTAKEDLIEGVVTSRLATDTTQFELVVSEKVLSGSGSILSGVNVGDPVEITLGSSPTFFVDRKALSTNTTDLPSTAIAAFEGAADNSVIYPGQMIVVRPTSFTPATGSTIAAATVDAVGLRWTRISGTVSQTPTAPNFDIAGLPPFLPVGVPANSSIVPFPTLIRVQTIISTHPGATVFDPSSLGSVTGLAINDSVSIRALYFGPTPTGTDSMVFLAEKLRKH